MQVAAFAVEVFREWVLRTAKTTPWEHVGEALYEWLAEGGVLYLNEDWTVFLEMALYLAIDPSRGVPSGRFMYRVDGKTELVPLSAVNPNAQGSSDWSRWYERELFERAVFRYYHPWIDSSL